MTRVRQDSNLFRVSNNAKDDTIGYLGAGFKSDFKLSRQHLLLDAEVERAKYDNFDNLDHTSAKSNAAWGWRVGNLWNGRLGVRVDRVLRSFTQSQVFEKDMRTQKVTYFDAGYQIHPDWQLVAGFNYTDVAYQERKLLERNFSSGLFEVKYRNTLNTKVGIRVKYTDYSLQSRIISGVRISNDYTETEISGTFYWEGSAKSKLEMRLGYTDQNYDELTDRDYQGSTGRLTYKWQMSGKTRLDLSIWRETSSLNYEVINYVLTKGISIQPVWSVTPLITLRGIFSYKNDDFKAQNSTPGLGSANRDDDTYQYGIRAGWMPRRNIDLSLDYKRSKRDSSINTRDYTDDQIEARARYNFF